jgi:hypothetical protein
MERVALSALIGAQLHPHTTLVVPPAQPLRRNEDMLRRLAALDAAPDREET